MAVEETASVLRSRLRTTPLAKLMPRATGSTCSLAPSGSSGPEKWTMSTRVTGRPTIDSSLLTSQYHMPEKRLVTRWSCER